MKKKQIIYIIIQIIIIQCSQYIFHSHPQIFGNRTNIEQYYQNWCDECQIDPFTQVDPSYTGGTQNMTFAMYLADQGIIPPKEWEHNPNITSTNGQTVAIKLARKGVIPTAVWYHSPEYQDREGWTVAMRLVQNKRMPPAEWYHDPSLKDRGTGLTVEKRLINNKMMVPQEWKVGAIRKQKITGQINQGSFLSEDPTISAQYMSINERDSSIVNLQQNQQPRFQQPQTSQSNQVNIPKDKTQGEFIFDIHGNTQAMYIAMEGKVPQENFHSSEIQNRDGFTVAMILANNGIIPPKEWAHERTLKNAFGQTVQSLLKGNDINVPQIWAF